MASPLANLGKQTLPEQNWLLAHCASALHPQTPPLQIGPALVASQSELLEQPHWPVLVLQTLPPCPMPLVQSGFSVQKLQNPLSAQTGAPDGHLNDNAEPTLLSPLHMTQLPAVKPVVLHAL